MGVITAPVLGSGDCPAWMARVQNDARRAGEAAIWRCGPSVRGRVSPGQATTLERRSLTVLMEWTSDDAGSVPCSGGAALASQVIQHIDARDQTVEFGSVGHDRHLAFVQNRQQI